MYADEEKAIRIAIEEGILTQQEAAPLQEEARRLGHSPLKLLRERGRFSEETFALLLRRASGPEEQHAKPEEAVPHEQIVDRQASPLVRILPLDETVTVPPALGSPPPAASPPGNGAEGAAFPIPGWDRYQHIGFLGQGGMGRVFLAYDPRLRRQVALKFVRDDHPELTRRFLSEARAQAKVNHERVCKVYEVGQIDQKLFIAMQYVQGRPLGEFVHELTVEQKALVLRDSALGVHEAHRAGLIHRDIKPSNILVERTEDGIPRPYVMDFGLARDWTESVTVTGTVLGTPHYMAPEQARGEVARLDRRADVYSLGATLYALLTGQPPIQGSNGLEVLSNLAIVEPRPPRELDRNIPPDLEAITLKCLEKEPSARYDSARALADDLDRFLSGEPVLARMGPGYRLRKRLRKHRLLLTAITAVLLALVVVAGLRVRLEVSRREALARRFTTWVERIESRTRYSALSRLHDAREDRQALRAQMEELEAELSQSSEQALGPGHDALGRGALALGDTGKAREHLELAWRHGFMLPRTAYALGLALGLPYQQQLLEVEKIREDTERREARLRELERRYRDPAIAYLKQSEGVEEPLAEYTQALIAFYEGRLDEALARLEAVNARHPWFYEAPKLQGDIFVIRFYQRRREMNEEGARADLEAGRKAYAAATTIAESVPSVHLGLAQLEGAEMVLWLFKSNRAIEAAMPSYHRAQDALMKCLSVAPDDYGCQTELARLHVTLAMFSGATGGDLETILAKAREAAEHAQALAPTRHEARMVLADSFLALALNLKFRGEDPRELFFKAAEALESIRPEDRDFQFHISAGWLYMIWPDDASPLGENARGHGDRAIQEYEAALAIDDRSSIAWGNLGDSYSRRASVPSNSNAEFDWVRAQVAYDKARSLNPRYMMTYAGRGYWLRAQWLRNQDKDPMPDLMRALEHLQQVLSRDPNRDDLYPRMGEVLQEQASEIWDRGGDPFVLLDQAQFAFEYAISAEPTWDDNYYNLGTLLTQRARYLRARGEDPGPSLSAAEESVKRGVQQVLNDDSYSIVRDQVRVYRSRPGPDPRYSTFVSQVHFIRAAFNVDRGRPPGPDLTRAEEEVRQAMARDPKNSDAWLQLGDVQTLRAQWQARSGKARDEDFEEAAKSYEQAVALEPDKTEYLLRLGQHCATWATWQKQAGGDNGRVLKRGMELADQLLKLRPNWAKARTLRANLVQLSQ